MPRVRHAGRAARAGASRPPRRACDQPRMIVALAWSSSGLRNGEQTACQTDAAHARAAREGDLAEVGVVHVAGERDDRGRRRRRARPRRPSAAARVSFANDVAERRPVLEVDAPGASSRRPSPPRRPRRRRRRASFQASRWCSAGRQQIGQRGGQQQVVEAAGGVLGDPVPLLVVHHLARVPSSSTRPARESITTSRVLAEVAAVAPARVGLSRGRPRGRTRAATVPAVLGLPHLREQLVVAVLRRARGCRGAGRPSRTSARPRCARSTSPSRASPRSHASEVFQSSCTSWSSKIIAVDTIENSQRIVGSLQASR